MSGLSCAYIQKLCGRLRTVLSRAIKRHSEGVLAAGPWSVSMWEFQYLGSSIQRELLEVWRLLLTIDFVLARVCVCMVVTAVLSTNGAKQGLEFSKMGVALQSCHLLWLPSGNVSPGLLLLPKEQSEGLISSSFWASCGGGLWAV